MIKKGMKLSEEHKKKLSLAWDYNKHFTQSTKNKISNSLKGKRKSEEHKTKMRKPKEYSHPAWKKGLTKEDNRVKFYKIDTSHIWGHEQRNYFITNIPVDDNDWCYFLDDDNVVTWDLISTYNEEKNSDVDLVLFSQKAGLTEKIRLYGDGEHRLD
jgi:hypothetical protein